MVSTVTTTTSSAVVLGASLGLIAIVLLLGLLIQKELLTASSSPRSRALSQALNLAIVPLLMGFAFIAIVKVIDVLP